jgi:hypothetical protein
MAYEEGGLIEASAEAMLAVSISAAEASSVCHLGWRLKIGARIGGSDTFGALFGWLKVSTNSLCDAMAFWLK